MYFHAAIDTRKTVEIATQMYQLVRVRYSVGEQWINILAVSIVVLNCWTTPLLDLSLHHNEPLRRGVCLAVDIMLDPLASTAVPFLVFATYRSKLPRMDWYDPLWIMDAGNDLLYFHVNTWLDLFSRLLPAISVTGCMNNIRKLVVRQPPSSST